MRRRFKVKFISIFPTLLYFNKEYEIRHKKNETNPIAREKTVEGRDKQTAIEHVLTCRSVTRLSSIALLSTSGRIFKYMRVLILGAKMSDCKTEQRVTSSFLLN